MDPFSIALTAAIAAALKNARDDRTAAEFVLMAWNRMLRTHRGKAGTRVPIKPAVRKALEYVLGGHCAYESFWGDNRCAGGLTVDHRVPLNAGGNNYWENLQLVCARHNSSKRAQMELEYRHRQQQR